MQIWHYCDFQKKQKQNCRDLSIVILFGLICLWSFALIISIRFLRQSWSLASISWLKNGQKLVNPFKRWLPMRGYFSLCNAISTGETAGAGGHTTTLRIIVSPSFLAHIAEVLEKTLAFTQVCKNLDIFSDGTWSHCTNIQAQRKTMNVMTNTCGIRCGYNLVF